MTSVLTKVIGLSDWWAKTVNYEVLRGNPIWRFVLVLLVLLVAMAAGRIVQYGIETHVRRREEKTGANVITLLLKCLSKPIYVAIFALGLFACKLCLYFNDDDGIRTAIGAGWVKMAKTVAAIGLAYGLYRLVDVIEYYLQRIVGKTETKLDDMLVPVTRKALRITIAIIAAPASVVLR